MRKIKKKIKFTKLKNEKTKKNLNIKMKFY